jgi:hypothetical protein
MINTPLLPSGHPCSNPKSRYRALVGAMPTFCPASRMAAPRWASNPVEQSSYSFGQTDQALAEALVSNFDEAAAIAATADPKAIGRLADEPRPPTIVRRVSPI